ncbi:alternative ribosome rescue aminoacyl-tRNA hydrolase ArfB [Chloroflexota bacterium]
MIKITSNVQLDESEVHYDLIRASGPGGQNVNKVSSAIQLRFDIHNSPSLTAGVKERLIKLTGSRVTKEGVLVIEAKRYRTQDQNRADALRRLVTWIQKALNPPKKRKATRPSVSAKARRLGEKKRRSQAKRIRRYIPEDWE